MSDDFCWVCGQFSALDGCHVKDKKEFSESQQDDKFDRERNIIMMCKAHHKLFDVRKEIGVVKLIEDNYHFTRINHCSEGICATESLEPMINLFFRDLGDEGADIIHPDYIKWKNKRLADDGHRDFAKKIDDNWSKCKSPDPEEI